MDKIYRHEDGSLYVKIESQCLNGIFSLQMVHPEYGSIDPYWFEQELEKMSIVELKDETAQKSFILKLIHWRRRRRV